MSTTEEDIEEEETTEQPEEEEDEEEEDSDAEIATVVCDNGSGNVKCGEGGADAPELVFPNLVGKPRYKAIMAALGQKELYVGEDAMSKRGVLSLTNPISSGVVQDWTSMEAVWEYMFTEALQREAEDTSVLMSEAPLNPRANREKMAEIMFETFRVRGFYCAVQGALALYAAGRITGLVLDSGDGLTHTVPIFDGYALPHAMKRVNVGGRDLTYYMAKQLGQQGVELSSGGELQVAREIKEAVCYIAEDFQAEMDKDPKDRKSQKFELPDGVEIEINGPALRTPECLFSPELIGRDPALSLPGLLHGSVMATEMDNRKEFYQNILLCGGNTMFKGFPERIQAELAKRTASPLKILAPPERKYTVWIGGSIMSQLSSYKNSMVISAEEYEEHGARILHERCFS